MAKSEISIAEIFGGVLREHRERIGVSQEELAFRAGVDRTFISRLERGIRQPTITTLIGLAGALQITSDLLAHETEIRYKKIQKLR